MAELVETQVSRYQEYKPTGVEWMPEIPVGWKVKKLKIFIEDLESGVSVNSFDEPVIGDELGILKTSCVYSYKFDHSENKKVLAEEVDRVRVPVKGDTLIISRMNTPDLVGASGYVGKDFPNLFLPDRLWQTVFRQNTQFKCFPKWLSYVFVSAPFRMLITSLATGTSPSMKNISKEEVLNIQVGLPALDEQRTIAFFLDDKTAQLDLLITQKQQMLELLREERAALINHVVTKGLDAAAPLCDSGVEWLGEVPAHWEVKRLKHLLVKMEQGWSPSCESRPAEIGEWGVLKAGCVNGLDFDATENKALPSELTPLPEYEINPGDFLISRANTKELVGSAVVVGEVRPMLLLCDKIFRLFFRENANKEYVLLIISSWYGRFQIQSESSGASSSMQNISQEFLKNMLILLPDRHEQHAIVEYVAEQTSRILETTDTINQEIALLQEYRAALIAEAVTGQIDVRHYVPATVLT